PGGLPQYAHATQPSVLSSPVGSPAPPPSLGWQPGGRSHSRLAAQRLLPSPAGSPAPPSHPNRQPDARRQIGLAAQRPSYLRQAPQPPCHLKLGRPASAAISGRAAPTPAAISGWQPSAAAITGRQSCASAISGGQSRTASPSGWR